MKYLILIITALSFNVAMSQTDLNINIPEPINFRVADLKWVIGTIGYQAQDTVMREAKNKVTKIVADTIMAMRSRGAIAANGFPVNSKVIPITNIYGVLLFDIYRSFNADWESVTKLIGDNIDLLLDAVTNSAFQYHRGQFDGAINSEVNRRLLSAEWEVRQFINAGNNPNN